MTVSGTWGNLERLKWTRSVKARQIDEPDQVDSVHIGSICAMENNGVAALHNLYTAMDVAIKWERYMCCRLIATVQLLNHFYPCVCQSLSVCYRLCAFWIEAEHFRIINVYYWTQSKWPSNLWILCNAIKSLQTQRGANMFSAYFPDALSLSHYIS